MAQDPKTKAKPTLLGRIVGAVRLTTRLAVTLVIGAGAVVAVQFGSAELQRRADAVPPPEAAPLIPVATAPLNLQDGYDVRRTFVGQVEPQKTVSLSFELPGRLADISVDEGDRVRQGQVLARQDLSLLEAERTRLIASRTASEAQLRFAGQTVDRNAELTERGFASQARLDEALARQDELNARIAEIDAALDDVAIRIAKSQVLAPFDGRVTARLVDGGETLGAGQQIFGLVALQKPQVRIGVPLDLSEADLATPQIEIDGAALSATLVTLRPDIDPVTRTRTAIFEIATDADLAFGRTAQLRLARRVTTAGLWLSTTSLKEGVRGQWTILTVDADSTVRAAPVEVLHAESDRVFVRAALPDGTRLIKEGPQRVTVGQRVTTRDTL